MNIKRDDLVVVISGNHSGRTPAKVLKIEIGGRKVELQGIGSVLKHVKRGHPKSPQGGRVQIPTLIAIDKLALYCAKCGRGCRVGVKVLDGVKRRICVRCLSSF